MRPTRFRTLLATTALAVTLPTLAHAQQDTNISDTQPATQTPQAEPLPGENEVVVTARKRQETLLDVPIAATAISGNTLQERGINSVREAAVLTPGLNINSDGAGRAFVAIRGVGVTLVQTVQPGVGLFIDGIYQPNTSYLNNPLVDVDRIEVLRGPQGTLYGKNTMGGAINVITRVPGNELEVRGSVGYAGPDDQFTISGAVSGALIEDKLQVRVAASHREQDGFVRNSIIGVRGNPLNTDSINGTIRFVPATDVVLTVKGYYDWVNGVNTPYARVSGPTDYQRTIQFNTPSRVEYRYRGVNARLQFPLEALSTEVTLIGSYDARNGRSRDIDADFGRVDTIRADGGDRLRTKTVEARFDSEISEQLTSLVGLFYSREELRGADATRIIPVGLLRNTTDARRGDTYSAFGTLFWKPATDLEVSLGLRYDHEDRRASGTVTQTLGGTTFPTAIVPEAKLTTDQLQPKLSVTKKWTPDLMSYASVARGYRGGGFNAPTAPFRTYKGDSVWTYEVGTKYSDRMVTLSGAIFYNDYRDYVGLNSIAPAAGGGLVTVDLNAGDVESYGLELEGVLRPVANWTISGGVTLMRARLINFDAYTATTNRVLSSDRLTFQPDVSGNLYSDYVIPLGAGEDTVTVTGGMTYKGKRLAGTLNETTPTFLKGYALLNAALTYKTGGISFGLFANNILNKDYFESYIERTTLLLAGLTAPLAAPATDLGIIGERRRYGVRASLRF